MAGTAAWRRKGIDEVYGADEVVARLAAELPRWRFEDGCLVRRFATGGWKSTLMAVNTVGHLAEAAWHHPELVVSYAALVVRLATHSPPGITERDFALARKIEEVLMWQPGREAAPVLEGTPDDARFKYLEYD